ncbi:F-box and WD-40 domain protein 7 [Nematocida sp. AWRm80]|nr:F-box and WD-40 domain protein 7 [Nematocida sp. AWRm80]
MPGDNNRFTTEILQNICSRLSLKDIKNLMGVSRVFRRRIEENPIIWKRCLESTNSSYGGSLYKVAVQKEYTQSRGWINNRIQNKKCLDISIDCEVTNIKVYQNIVVISCDAPTVYVYNAFSERVSCLQGHKGGVWSFDYRDNLLLTGSNDKSARIWDCFLGVCIRVLVGHTSTVRCVLLTDKYAITGARDNTIRIWSVKSGRCKYILSEHKGSIRDMTLVPETTMFVSVSYDGSSILWDYSTGKPLEYLHRAYKRLYTAHWITNLGVSIGGMLGCVSVVSLDNNQSKVLLNAQPTEDIVFKIRSDSHGCIYTLTINGKLTKWDVLRQVPIYAISLDEVCIDLNILNYLVVVGTKTKLCLYHKSTGEYIRTITHVDRLYSFCATDKSIYYGIKSQDKIEIHTIEYQSTDI